ncbi:MAG: 30S ribosomal protein S12 methylthiotransferase RimO [Candidatus Omnitrophota bacterium]|nr:30S ribosomal protein S12 methylthiotransferase RimO [Candidatus Omnitrophota bacterium]
MRVGIISLGCARNLVDSEQLLGRINQKGFEIVDIDCADVAIVNTCAFIQEATEESLDIIFELLELKKKGKLKKIIVAGCLPQRYKQELYPNLKGVDCFVGKLSLNNGKLNPTYKLTPRHFSYVKICEGCVNKCSYCVIPKIKGPFTSREISSIVDEVKRLDQERVVEINLIGQDITSYGMDLYKKPKLTHLLKEILKSTQNFKWLRLIYTHPSHIEDSLIEIIKNEERIVKYIDLPIQHINDKILRMMNRKVTKKYLLSLIEKLRKEIPSIAIRTSLIVGFPGETDQNFKELLNFIEEIKFERLGVFIYSREKETPAYNFQGHLPEKIKKERFDILMQQQQKISQGINACFMGKEMEILIDTEDVDKKLGPEENIYLGRTYADAPEVDGIVYVYAKKKHIPGEFVKVRIKDTLEYDLVGEEL